MKLLGILVAAVVAGSLAAGVALATGGTVWAAILNYLVAGMGVTALGTGFLIWRAIEAERPSSQVVIRSAAAVAGK